ncbi:Asp-tRNA(Asn)/Glu-tRNA(Gln) amidotransferase subunit GatB [Candidatus Daviesbacteria bacterium]|nr:Asp-tRNA(Asn)/Glu-tRNA(Gln) amidotransferase subunit GatB [Candidatus Daviesbacteria bacterium]
MNYEPVIGLEVHVELNTKSKMFCRCSADYFGKEPNTHTCPVCLGLPGALPYINKAAIEDCIKIGLALNCTVSERSSFERKNYFYPDLPKGYQISQYRWPLCVGGRLQVTGDRGQDVTIRINRAHQEEDTGKLTHSEGVTLIDFNRSGVPLVEIVTEPDFTDTAQVRDYAKKLQQLFRYLGVSNADMERGDMRLEANVSVRPVGQKELPNYRVELKNINSFRFMVAAIEHEIKRQIAALEKGEKLSQETRGWNEDKKSTFLQRSKEEAHDYRYFPEPDLPELKVDRLQVTVDSIKKSMPELPWDKSKRFVEELKLTEAQAKMLSETKELANFFEEAVKAGNQQEVNAITVANYIINQKVDIKTVKPSEVIEKIKSKSAGLISDARELEKLAQEAIEENPQMVEAYKKGKVTVIQAMIGSVMKKTGGKVNPNKIREILEEKLR